MTPLQRLSTCCGMVLACVAFGLSLGTRWSGASFFAALWCCIIGAWLLSLSPDNANEGPLADRES